MSSVLDNLPVIREYGSLPVELLHADGRLIRRESGKIFQCRGVTGFPLIDHFSKGIDIDSFIDYFSSLGANVLRVFWYTPVKDWGTNAWNLPSPDDLVAFHKYVGSRGWYVENVSLTDDNIAFLSDIRKLILALKLSGLKNALGEAKNEAYVHDNLNPDVLRSAWEDTPYLYASGINPQDNSGWIGKYITYHTPREPEEVRTSKDSEEICSSYKVPAVADEPSRPDQNFMNPLDYYTYAALANLMGSGATFHFESAKLGNMPNDYEKQCAQMFYRGLGLYPLDAQLGTYEHLRDMEEVTSDGTPTTCLRVFRKGQYAIIIRNKSIKIPGNWIPLDSYNVGFKIG